MYRRNGKRNSLCVGNPDLPVYRLQKAIVQQGAAVGWEDTALLKARLLIAQPHPVGQTVGIERGISFRSCLIARMLQIPADGFLFTVEDGRVFSAHGKAAGQIAPDQCRCPIVETDKLHRTVRRNRIGCHPVRL